MLVIECAGLEIPGAAERYRARMAEGFPKILRALYRDGRGWASDGFASGDAVTGVIERHTPGRTFVLRCEVIASVTKNVYANTMPHGAFIWLSGQKALVPNGMALERGQAPALLTLRGRRPEINFISVLSRLAIDHLI